MPAWPVRPWVLQLGTPTDIFLWLRLDNRLSRNLCTLLTDVLSSQEGLSGLAVDLTKSSTLKSLQKLASAKLSHRCRECGAHFFLKSQLDKHATIHFTTSQGCHVCRKTFANIYRLQRHMIR